MCVADLHQLGETIGHQFASPGLLVRAVTHPSYVAEQDSATAHNQRLEFLGDAVLQLALSEILFCRFPDMEEGPLTKLRSALAKASALAEIADGIDLGRYLLLGRGEEQHGGRSRESNLADAMEAVLAALYLDGGLAPVSALCQRVFEPFLDDPDLLLATENPKGALQELTHQRYQLSPVYTVEDVTGPDHLPEFVVRVEVSGHIVETARAGSRKTAEKEAARKALTALQSEAYSPSSEECGDG